VSYSQPNSDNLQQDVVGVFSDKAKAETAVDSFIEGFLEVGRFPHEIQEVNYQVHLIDSNVLELDNSNTSF
jgi:hypothetical protein